MLFAKNSARLVLGARLYWAGPILGLAWACCLLTVAVSGFAATTPPRAELPRVSIDTTYALPTGGTTWAAHTSAQLSSALNVSSPGDVIVLDAGVTYTGYFQLPAKTNPTNKWIYVISSKLSSLPEHTRVSPSVSAYMPKIVTPLDAPVFQVNGGANHWRFAGIEMTTASTYVPAKTVSPNGYVWALIGSQFNVKPQPDSITIDRCYIHGSPTQDVVTLVQGNANNYAVVDSYLSEGHAPGQDSQAFGAVDTLGPIKIVNNYLEAAGENIMFGGSGQNYNVGVPSDITIQNNYLFKPLAWVPLTTAPRNQWVEKDAFELKNAQRVLFDGNTIENVWAAAQLGYAVQLTVRSSQSGDFAVVNDVTITNNTFKNVVSGIDGLAKDDTCGTTSYPNCKNAGSQDRWYIANNLFTFFDPTLPGGQRNIGFLFSRGIDRINGGILGNMQGVVFQHNTMISAAPTPCYVSMYFSSGQEPYPPVSHITNNIWILDNVLCSQPNGDYGLKGTSGLNLYMAYPNLSPNDVTQRYYGNVMYVPTGTTVQTWPAHNYATTLPFVFANPASMDYQLTSPYWTNTSDGNLAGVDMTKLPSTASPMNGAPPTTVLTTPSTGLAGTNNTALVISATQR